MFRAIEQIAFSSDPSVKPELMRMLADLESEKQSLEKELQQNPPTRVRGGCNVTELSGSDGGFAKDSRFVTDIKQ
jgi:hypothetical protein